MSEIVKMYLMSIPKNALGQDVRTTVEMPTTFEHAKKLPTTFDQTPYNYLVGQSLHKYIIIRSPTSS